MTRKNISRSSEMPTMKYQTPDYMMTEADSNRQLPNAVCLGNWSHGQFGICDGLQDFMDTVGLMDNVVLQQRLRLEASDVKTHILCSIGNVLYRVNGGSNVIN